MDLNEFLKKAMEEEMRTDDEDAGEKMEFISEEEDNSIKGMLNIMSSGKLITMGKVAIDEKEKVVNDLADYLAKMDRSDRARYISRAATRIELAGKKLDILDTMVAAATMCSTAENDDMRKTVRAILGLRSMSF